MKTPPASMLLVAATLVLAGCSSPAATSAPDGMPSPTEAGVIGVPLGGDPLAALQGVTTAVLAVAVTDAGRWDITTRLVDPAEEDGSVVAQLAIAVCEEAVRRGATSVSLSEAGGASFVVYDVPVHGDDCAEV